jgi:hypothetical protein
LEAELEERQDEAGFCSEEDRLRLAPSVEVAANELFWNMERV